MRHLVTAASLAIAVANAIMSPAFAQQPVPPEQQALRTAALAATCANCHGTQGRAVQGATVPALAGVQQTYFVEQMKAFKSGARQATVMHQLAKGYSDAQVEQLAAYFAAQSR
jgi:cytochrome c553